MTGNYRTLVTGFLVMMISGCGMLQNSEDCAAGDSSICESFKQQPRVSLIVTLAGANAGDVENIQTLQNEFLASLPTQVNVTTVYKITPQIALETDLDGFNAIVRQNPDVEIALDETRLPLQNN